MAAQSVTSTHNKKQQSTLYNYGKIRKSVRSTINIKLNEKKIAALEDLINEEKPRSTRINKRKIEEVEEALVSDFNSIKKTKIREKSKSDEDETNISKASQQFDKLSFKESIKPTSISRKLPEILQDMIDLHKILLKAFSIHRAHNGFTPVEINGFLNTMTRLWKKKSVKIEDVRRILAVYEVAGKQEIINSQVKHRKSPFKLIKSGLGYESRTCLEYVFNTDTTDPPLTQSYREDLLAGEYRAEVEVIRIIYRNQPESFIFGSIEVFPMLACETGAQTISRQQKVKATRTEILNLSNRTKLQTATTDQTDDKQEVLSSIKSRTLSIFDRVRAKQLANSLISKPSDQDQLRQRSIGRISEIVEIIRMKHSQKSSANFNSSIHQSPSKAKGKVSFSINELIKEIKDSLSCPVAEEEIKMCFKVLSDEIPGFGLTVLTIGSVQTVVVRGALMTGLQVQQHLKGLEMSLQ